MKTPSTLYHYTSQAGLLGIIRNKSIWATHVAFLNDSEEINYALKLTLEILQNYVQKSEHSSIAKSILNHTEGMLSDSKCFVMVTSFSEKEDELSLWRGYTKPMNGYAIGFSSHHLKNHKAKLKKCIYDKNEQLKLITKWIDDYIDISIRNHNKHGAIENVGRFYMGRIKKLLDIACQIKHPGFHEEAEWRLVIGSAIIDNRLKFREGSSYLIPFIEHPIPSIVESIKEIIISPTPNPEISHLSTYTLLQQNYQDYPVLIDQIKNSKIPYREW